MIATGKKKINISLNNFHPFRPYWTIQSGRLISIGPRDLQPDQRKIQQLHSFCIIVSLTGLRDTRQMTVPTLTYFSGGSSYIVHFPILAVMEVSGLSSRSLWSSPAKEAGVSGMSRPSSIMSWPPLRSKVPGTLRAMARDLRLLGLLCIVLY